MKSFLCNIYGVIAKYDTKVNAVQSDYPNRQIWAYNANDVKTNTENKEWI